MFDSRQPHQRTFDTPAVETLRCDLLSLNQPCAFLDILVPPLCCHQERKKWTSDDLKAVCAEIKSTFNVSSVEREELRGIQGSSVKVYAQVFL